MGARWRVGRDHSWLALLASVRSQSGALCSARLRKRQAEGALPRAPREQTHSRARSGMRRVAIAHYDMKNPGPAS